MVSVEGFSSRESVGDDFEVRGYNNEVFEVLSTLAPGGQIFLVPLTYRQPRGLVTFVNSLASVPNLSQVVKYSEVRVSNPQGLCLYLD